jgi:hypothetical protein
MWKPSVQTIDRDRVLQVSLWSDATPLSHYDVIRGWRESELFRRFYISLLADAPFEAVFWETPPVTRTSLGRPHEFVLVNSPQLGSAVAESLPFAGYFNSAKTGESVVAFENLGQDAELIVPCPQGSAQGYAHLAAFVRAAPQTQCHELFRRLAQALEKRLSDKPLWVSTSGLGVYWLHIRLDSRPKYYTFEPYRQYP